MSLQQGYIYKILLFIDMFCCALVFRDPDVTISSETGLAMQRANPPRWAKLLNGILNKIQPGHCQMAIGADIQRAQMAIAYLTAKQS